MKFSPPIIITVHIANNININNYEKSTVYFATFVWVDFLNDFYFYTSHLSLD